MSRLPWSPLLRLGAAAGVLLAGMLAAAPLPAAAPAFVLSVVPTEPPVATHSNWTPFVARLERETGLDFTLKVYESMLDFEADLAGGGPDFALANPMQAVLVRAAGYEPLVRSSLPLTGKLFVLKDSPITDVEQIKGQPIAFVGAKSVCSIFTRHILQKRQARPLDFQPLFVGSTANVLKTVELGKAVAGATLDSDFELLDQADAARFRTIFTTPPITSHPLIAHPRVGAADRAAVTAAVLAIGADPGAGGMLARIRLSAPTRADYERDYRPLEAVDIRGFSTGR